MPPRAPSLSAPPPGWPRAAKNLAGELHVEGGSAVVYLPKPDLCFTVATGFLDVALARLFVDTITPLFADRKLAFFHDWHAMTAYDSAARRMLTSWTLTNFRAARSNDFFVASRIVAMGIAAANVWTSPAGVSLAAHTSREAFGAALHRDL